MANYADLLRGLTPRPTMGDIASLIEGTMTAHFCTTTGSANAFIAAPSPALQAYTAGAKIWIVANFTNTGAATINVNGLGAKAIVTIGNSALRAGDIMSGYLYALLYDGTSFRLLNQMPGIKTWDPSTGLGASGSMTASSLSAAYAIYMNIEKLYICLASFTLTLGGSGASFVYISTPATMATKYKDKRLAHASCYDGTSRDGWIGVHSSDTTKFQIAKNAAADAWTTGTSRMIQFTAICEAA